MTPSDVLKIHSEERMRANRIARDVLGRAKEEKVAIPTLVAAIVNEYACECEAAVEREMAREMW